MLGTIGRQKLITLPTIVLMMSAAVGFESATQISVDQGRFIVQTSAYARIPVVRSTISETGVVVVSGKISVTGKANLALWSVVEGKRYFSRLPHLQSLEDVSGTPFKIPFNAADKTITEIILEVETLGGGEVILDEIVISKD